VNSNFRLKNSIDFMRVRRFGKSYAHPLVVLVVLPVPDEHTRIGIVASRSSGNAVQRNHAKRMLREAIRHLMPQIKSGWKIILISRPAILKAELPEIQDTMIQLFKRANLINHQAVK
jgi:ribonuclease P protein component